MNKWIITSAEIFNLKRANRIYIGFGNNCWKLFADYGNVAVSDGREVELARGNETEMETKLKDVKDFSKSSESYLEME